MKERIPNILRAGVILMVLTVWMPTAAVLAYPHDNDWVEHSLATADIRGQGGCSVANPYRVKPSGGGAYARKNWKCPDDQRWVRYSSRVEWDGWMIYGPITLGLLAGLYLISGSLSLRPQRLQEG